MGEEKKESGGDATVEEKNKENSDDTTKDEKIVIKVDMHCRCEACAKKILRALRTSQGVEEVAVDRETNMVAIKGNKEVNPLKLCDRIRHKTGRKAQLVSPLPKPPQEQPKDDEKKKEEEPKKDQQPPPVVTVVLGIHMHCEACAQLLRKRIRKLKGVESVETDVGKGEAIVKGVIGDPEVLVEYVQKRTRKQVTIVKDSEEQQKQDSTSEQEKKQDKKDDNDGGVKNNNTVIDDAKIMMINRSFDYYSPSARYDYMEYHHHNNLNYQPLIFSDENPNACSIM